MKLFKIIKGGKIYTCAVDGDNSFFHKKKNKDEGRTLCKKFK
jgi:hypothetical protein